MAKKKESKARRFSHLLSPIEIGPVTLKNRIVLAPMNETMSGVNGEMTEQCLAYFAARAKGGSRSVDTRGGKQPPASSPRVVAAAEENQAERRSSAAARTGRTARRRGK